MATSIKSTKQATPARSTTTRTVKGKTAKSVTPSAPRSKSGTSSLRDNNTSRADQHMEHAWALLSKRKK
jgi:hypothetical protein